MRYGSNVEQHQREQGDADEDVCVDRQRVMENPANQFGTEEVDVYPDDNEAQRPREPNNLREHVNRLLSPDVPQFQQELRYRWCMCLLT